MSEKVGDVEVLVGAGSETSDIMLSVDVSSNGINGSQGSSGTWHKAKLTMQVK